MRRRQRGRIIVPVPSAAKRLTCAEGPFRSLHNRMFWRSRQTFSVRKNSRNFTKGVRIDLDGNKVTVDITIVVEYGSPVPDVARSIQENVKKAIETMSGLDVRNVDVHVQAVSFERENRAAQELKEQQQKLLENSLRQQDVQQAEAAPEAEEPAAEELGDLPEEEIVEDDGIEEEDDDLEDVDDLDEIDAADLDDLPGEEASEQLDSDGGQPQM